MQSRHASRDIIERISFINGRISILRFIFLLASGSVWMVSLCDNQILFTYISIAIFFLYFLSFAHEKPRLVLMFLPVLFSWFTSVLGAYSIETGSFYLDELGVYSGFVGSLPSFSFYYLIALFCLEYITGCIKLKRITLHFSTFEMKWISTIVSFCLVIFILVFCIALENPFFATGADRINYASTSSLARIVERTVAYGIYVVPLCAAAYCFGQKIKAVSCVVLYFAISFLSGNKFGIFLQIAWLLFVYFSAFLSDVDEKQIRKVMYSAFGCICILVCITLFHNSLNYGKSLGQNFQYLQERMAQNGQLWWRSFALQSCDDSHLDEIYDEFDSWFDTNADPATGSYGIYKVMKTNIAYDAIFQSVIAHGSRYTNSTPSTIFYYFGYPGFIIFAIVTGTVYSYLIIKMSNKFSDGKLLQGILLIRFYTLASQVFSMSDFDRLMSGETIVFIVLYMLVSKVSINKDRNAAIVACNVEGI